MDDRGDEKQAQRPASLPEQSADSASKQVEQELRAAKEELESKSVELARSLARLRATLEATTDAILVTDALGRVTDFNEKYVALCGLPREQLLSSHHRQILGAISHRLKNPQQDFVRIAEIYAASSKESFDVLELMDGKVFERSSRVKVVAGQIAGRVWSLRDITEYRRVEAALRDDARILELLNKTAASLTANLDLRTLVQAVTDAATQLSGAKFGAFFYNVNDDQGEAFMLYTLSGAPREAFEKLGHPRATPLFTPTFRGAGPVRFDDVREQSVYGMMGPHHGMPPGHLPVRSYLAVPVVSRSGEVIGGLLFGHPEPGVFVEQTEKLLVNVAAQAAIAIDNARLYAVAQKAAEERKQLLDRERLARAQAEKANEMKDEFLATLSHELRTPLSAILGWSQFLKIQPVEPDDLKRGLEAIERNANIQTQLIEDLIDMSRITSGKLRLQLQPLEPLLLVEAALETVRPTASAKGIKIVKMLDPSAGPVAGDPSRLQQVIWNLLSNAVKFTPKEGAVQISLSRVNSHIEITVADTGIGIETEFLPHVFERFRQQDASTTREFGGLGIGLSIVKHLVELHGGTVQVASRGSGFGSTFSVQLPLLVVRNRAYDGESTLPARSVDFKHSNLSGIKVLVVDDEADARELIGKILSACGAEVFAADTAEAALLAVETEQPHVLVSDIGMPIVDGYELLRRVRALGPTRGGRLPAIALTAFARSEDRTRALRAGFLVHVAKPVEPSELVATVASVVGRAGDSDAT